VYLLEGGAEAAAEALWLCVSSSSASILAAAGGD